MPVILFCYLDFMDREKMYWDISKFASPVAGSINPSCGKRVNITPEADRKMESYERLIKIISITVLSRLLMFSTSHIFKDCHVRYIVIIYLLFLQLILESGKKFKVWDANSYNHTKFHILWPFIIYTKPPLANEYAGRWKHVILREH